MFENFIFNKEKLAVRRISIISEGFPNYKIFRRINFINFNPKFTICIRNF